MNISVPGSIFVVPGLQFGFLQCFYPLSPCKNKICSSVFAYQNYKAFELSFIFRLKNTSKKGDFLNQFISKSRSGHSNQKKDIGTGTAL
jgi:hypothetical protein